MPDATPAPNDDFAFPSDGPLFYKVGIWGDRGYAVPNFGKNQFTVNQTIEEFVREGGRRLQRIMHHEDTGRVDPPSINSVQRMVLFCNRARTVIIGRAVDENERRFEGRMVHSSRRPFIVFPTPFFLVTNPLMRGFADLALALLAELMQSPETTQQHEISTDLANVCGSYIARFQKRIAMEYFGMAEADAGSPTLNLMDHLVQYTPSKQGIDSAEPLDQGGTLSLPGVRDLGILAQGIRVPELPALGPYTYPTSSVVAPATPAPPTATGTSAQQLPPLPST